MYFWVLVVLVWNGFGIFIGDVMLLTRIYDPSWHIKWSVLS